MGNDGCKQHDIFLHGTVGCGAHSLKELLPELLSTNYVSLLQEVLWYLYSLAHVNGLTSCICGIFALARRRMSTPPWGDSSEPALAMLQLR